MGSSVKIAAVASLHQHAVSTRKELEHLWKHDGIRKEEISRKSVTACYSPIALAAARRITFAATDISLRSRGCLRIIRNAVPSKHFGTRPVWRYIQLLRLSCDGLHNNKEGTQGRKLS